MPTSQFHASQHRQIQVNAAIDAKTVKQLRDATGAGMMDCKKALTEHDGDLEKASEYLRKKGIASADKKAARGTSEGIIQTYIHTGSKLAVMVEVNCETDFVAKNPEFKEFGKEIAMQIAASPDAEVVSEADISPEFMEKEKKILQQAEDMQGKPPEIVEKMISGRIGKILKTKTLMDQSYIKDPNKNVETVIKEAISKFGENIKIARFARWNLGEAPESPAPAPAPAL